MCVFDNESLNRRIFFGWLNCFACANALENVHIRRESCAIALHAAFAPQCKHFFINSCEIKHTKIIFCSPANVFFSFVFWGGRKKVKCTEKYARAMKSNGLEPMLRWCTCFKRTHWNSIYCENGAACTFVVAQTKQTHIVSAHKVCRVSCINADSFSHLIATRLYPLANRFQGCLSVMFLR